jgi:coatomer protein complex subunit alpha (xenin)
MIDSGSLRLIRRSTSSLLATTMVLWSSSLKRERPASAFYQNNLFFITKEKHVRSYDFQKNIESPTLLTLKKLGSPWVPPRSLSYNPAERAILVTSPADGGSYELINLPRDGSGSMDATDTKRGPGQFSCVRSTQSICCLQRRLANRLISRTSQIQPRKPSSRLTGTTDIYFGGTGNLLSNHSYCRPPL